MDFRVTVMVEVDDKKPNHLKDITDPVEYAKRFVYLSPAIYGSHDIDFVDGKIVKALDVVSTEVVWQDVYEI